MNGEGRTYIAIDLKSFYASVECVERGLDPLDACLVVADKSRTEKTICLAVSPALKAFGTGGRPRLFEVVEKVKEANRTRGRKGKSRFGKELAEHQEWQIDYFVAPPRMALYIDYSTRIFDVYLRFVSPEDVHVYSIDEIFIDATSYLEIYKTSPHDLAMTMIRAVLAETGVTATAGIGSNLYLCKVAMDIVAKKMPPDKDGVRIAELDERSYRQKLWDHMPLTDFWRVGSGTARRLAHYGIFTMGDLARASIQREDLLYKLFGINAELLIDHAWGWEPVTIDLIKTYRPETHSLSSGQVLTCPYTAMQARNVIMEMADALSYDLVEKRLVTDQLVVYIGYDVESLTRPEVRSKYHGKIHIDHYGRPVPEHANGTVNLSPPSSSGVVLIENVVALFDRIINPDLLVRRLNVSANHLVRESEVRKENPYATLNLFSNLEEDLTRIREKKEKLDRERKQQELALRIKKKFGKNALLKGLNYSDGATQRNRNSQIGGHHS